MASKKKRLSVPFSASSSSTDTVDKETLILGEMSPPDNVSSSSTEVNVSILSNNVSVFSDLFMQMLLEMERFFFKHILLKIIEKEEKDRGRDKTDI